MKKLFVLAVMVICSCGIFAQGIKFEHGSFADALAKAKAENKLLFVDFYTTWCGPCKKMSKEIFPREEVGTYFNDKFISLKIDAEKGEGIELREKYEVKSFPTMIFFNADGTVNKRMSGATPNPEFLINFGKQVLGEVKPFLGRYEEYKQGKRDLDFIRDLILDGHVYASTLPRNEQKPWAENLYVMARWYFVIKKPGEMMNKKDFRLISSYFDGPFNGTPFVEHIYNNYEEWAKIIPSEDLSRFIFAVNNKSIQDSYRAGNLKFREYLEAMHGRLAQVFENTPNVNADDSYKMMKYVAEGGYCLHASKDIDGYLDWTEKYIQHLKDIDKINDRAYFSLISNCMHFAKESITEKHAKRMIVSVKEGLKLNKNSTHLSSGLGDLYALIGQNKKAIEQYEKVIELTKGNTKNSKYYQNSMTEKINALK